MEFWPINKTIGGWYQKVDNGIVTTWIWTQIAIDTTGTKIWIKIRLDEQIVI